VETLGACRDAPAVDQCHHFFQCFTDSSGWQALFAITQVSHSSAPANLVVGQPHQNRRLAPFEFSVNSFPQELSDQRLTGNISFMGQYFDFIQVEFWQPNGNGLGGGSEVGRHRPLAGASI